MPIDRAIAYIRTLADLDTLEAAKVMEEIRQKYVYMQTL